MPAFRTLLVTLAVLGTAAAPASAPARATKTVRIQDIDFSPHVVRIHRGDSVRWRFLDGRVSHNVTSRGRKRFRSSDTMLKGTFRVRFSRAGTYRYFCTIHPSMRGKVVVK